MRIYYTKLLIVLWLAVLGGALGALLGSVLVFSGSLAMFIVLEILTGFGPSPGVGSYIMWFVIGLGVLPGFGGGAFLSYKMLVRYCS